MLCLKDLGTSISVRATLSVCGAQSANVVCDVDMVLINKPILGGCGVLGTMNQVIKPVYNRYKNQLFDFQEMYMLIT